MAPLIVNNIFVSIGEKTNKNNDQNLVKYNFDSKLLFWALKSDESLDSVSKIKIQFELISFW